MKPSELAIQTLNFITEEKELYTILSKNGKRPIKTHIPPEERTLKNLPRDSKGKPKVRFQDWLGLKKTRPSSHSVGQAYDGTWYGWSHRAIRGFKVGDVIKPDYIGNKYEYSEKARKEYRRLLKTKSIDKADKIIKEKYGRFEPYKIKSEKEAFEHAERFAKDVA